MADTNTTRKKHFILLGGGFVGSYLATEILKRSLEDQDYSYKITVIDKDMNTGTETATDYKLLKIKENIDKLYPEIDTPEKIFEGSEEKMNLLQMDLSSFTQFPSTVINTIFNETDPLENYSEDDRIIIFNLAANLGVQNVIEDKNYLQRELLLQDSLFMINQELYYSLIDLEKDPKKILTINYFSTSEVYGDKKYMREDSSCEIHLNNPNYSFERQRYALIKLFTEALYKEFHLNTEIDVNIIRPFNVIGPFQNENFVIPKMFSNLINDPHKITIYGDGLQKRTFIYVKDFVVSLLDFIDRKASDEEKRYSCEFINLANIMNVFAVKDLAIKIINTVNENNYLKNFIPEDSDYSEVYFGDFIEYLEVDGYVGEKERVPNINKLYKEYRVKPRTPLTKILKIYKDIHYSNI